MWVNTYLQTRHELPFGGIKESGYGHDEVLEFTREKAVVIALAAGARMTGRDRTLQKANSDLGVMK